MADTRSADAAVVQADKDANAAKEKATVVAQAAAAAHVEETKRADAANDKIAHEHAEEVAQERAKM